MSEPGWLQGARGAPSAHNTQPWRFTVLPDGRVAVGWAAERTLPVADPTSRDLYLSLGAAVESACLRSLADGAPLQFEPAPDAAAAVANDRMVGWLVPAPSVTVPDPLDLKLAAALNCRQTARGPHLPRPVPPDLYATLIAEAARHGRVLQIVTDRPRISRLAKLAGKATAVLFADEPVHAELWRWLRLDPSDPAYRRDGLTADCLELAGAILWLARQTMPPARMRWLTRLGLHHLLASDTATVTRQSAAICLLRSPGMDRAALVETGRVLQRLWLLAATAGLTTHPLSALLDCSETAGLTNELVSGGGNGPHPPTPSPCARERGSQTRRTPLSPGGRGAGGEGAPPGGEGASSFPAAVFRLGHAAPAARSPRLPLHELLMSY